MQIRADLHVHTTYSKDSLITPRDLVYYSKMNGLNAVAVTDHDTLEGACKIAKETDFIVIPGMEVSSAEGHIVALNIQDPIPKGLSARETVEQIHRAGGVAVACHPFVRFKGSLRNRVCETFDAIEVINARAVPYIRSVKLAQETAETLNLSRVAGTDAHYGPQIGYGYTVIDAEDTTVEALCRAIVAGRCQPFGQAMSPRVNFELTLARLMRIVTKKPPHLV